MMKNRLAVIFLNSRCLQTCGVCVLLQLAVGCSSWLDISEKTEAKVVSSKYLGGIALNRPQVYELKIDSGGLCNLPGIAPCTAQAVDHKLVGIDQHHLLIVNATRMPFSSAGLTVKTTDKQIAKEIGLESKTGAAGLPKSASAALDAKAEREKIKLEAKEKEDQAKAGGG